MAKFINRSNISEKSNKKMRNASRFDNTGVIGDQRTSRGQMELEPIKLRSEGALSA